MRQSEKSPLFVRSFVVLTHTSISGVVAVVVVAAAVAAAADRDEIEGRFDFFRSIWSTALTTTAPRLLWVQHREVNNN